MAKTLISAIIIARNEEENIGKCLDSLRNCTQESIVIVDDRTNDRTIDIIKEKGARFEVRKWEGYVKTKQYALSLACNEWILWIDADEALTGELSKEITDVLNDNPMYSAYSFPRKAFFLNKWIKHSGWYPGRVTRLFNKQLVSFKEKDVHEHLIVSGNTGELKNDLLHWTDPSIEHYFKKFNSYTSLAAIEMAENNVKATLTDLIIRPAFLFFKMYFLKRGFLDGLHGFILAIFSSVYVFTKYCKLKEINTSAWRYYDNRDYPQHS